MYSFGDGVDLDYATAYRYANRAAHLGEDLGILNIGQYYEHGIELTQSDIKAYAHYFIARKLGQQPGKDDSEATKGLNSVKARMSASQIQAAEQEIPKLMQEYGL
jgi:TPR repeat protein